MHNIRRSDRAIEKEEALDILKKGEYGVLSTAGSDNQPYGVPVNFCVIDNSIYFHCAIEGRKIDNFACNPKVSFCVVGNTRVLPSKFGTEYESTIVSGMLSEAFDKEKQKAIEGLLRKYSSGHFEEGLKYIDTLKEKTRVFRIAIETITGKSRR
jgi:uncharacterized protein